MLESDLMQVLIQPKRSMLYNRQFGAGIKDRENFPNAVSLQIGLRYDIASAIAYRNTVVSDGTDNTRDRRIASSQFSIEFKQDRGNLDIRVYYFNFVNTKQIRSVDIESGGLL